MCGMLLSSQGHIIIPSAVAGAAGLSEEQRVGRPWGVYCGSKGLSLKPGYNISPDYLLPILTKQPSVNVRVSSGT